jgi:hypothetical protein
VYFSGKIQVFFYLNCTGFFNMMSSPHSSLHSPFKRHDRALCISQHAALIEEESEQARLANVKRHSNWWKAVLLANPITCPFMLCWELIQSRTRNRSY